MADAKKTMEQAEKKNIKPLAANEPASANQAAAVQKKPVEQTDHPSASPATPKMVQTDDADKQHQKTSALKRAVIISTLYKVASMAPCCAPKTTNKKKSAMLTKKAELIVKKAELKVAIRQHGVDSVLKAVQRAVKN